MTAILLTGMSGTGKSTVITELARRGLEAVDTDHGGFVEQGTEGSGSVPEPLWREDRIAALLDRPRHDPLFVSGCVANQYRFYPRFADTRQPVDDVVAQVLAVAER